MNDVMIQEEFTARCQRVLQVARQLFQGKPDWVTFFRETLGVSGAARSVFPDQQEYVTFEKSREYAEIQSMVLRLRNRKIPGGGANEPTRVITVRLPESLHEALKAEAADHGTSMNKLCISKLLQVLADNLNPAQRQQAMAALQRQQQMAAAKPATPPQPTPAASQPVSQPAQVPATPQFRSTFNQSQPSQPTPQPRPTTPDATSSGMPGQ